MRVLCLGDVVARPGRQGLAKALSDIKNELAIDYTIANGENSSGGSGIDKKCYQEILAAGVDFITLGDHTWRRSEFVPFVTSNDTKCIAPANYPSPARVIGYSVQEIEPNGSEKVSVGIANIMCRTFMNAALDCPFQKMEEILSGPFGDATIKIVDLHGEATSEKIAFSKHFDGKLSLVYGTHTHVQTADEEILAGGTARISDIGMCGSHAGVIGMDPQTAIFRFLSGKPSTYKPASGDVKLNGIIAEIGDDGKARSIERVSRAVEV